MKTVRRKYNLQTKTIDVTFLTLVARKYISKIIPMGTLGTLSNYT